MLSSGTRIAIVMLVLLVVGTAAYWVFLADPGPDPLAVGDPDDTVFLDADPDDVTEPDRLVLGGGQDRRPIDPVPLPGPPEPTLPDDDDLRRLQDELDRERTRELGDDDRIVRPWDTMRRVAAGGPIRVGGEGRGAAGERPPVGDDRRDPDAGKDAGAFEEGAGDDGTGDERTGEREPPVERTTPTPPRDDDRPAERGADGAWGEHVVAAGDTVVGIAERWFGEPGHWDLVLRANPGVDPTRLTIGQRLRLPPRDWRPTVDPPRDARPGERFHEVRPGETLSVIARRHYGSAEHWRAIYDANRATIGADPGRLQVGMRLRIPPAPE